jgi:hypothetical protein
MRTFTIESQDGAKRTLFLLMAIVAAIRLIGIDQIPITLDEAYYAAWSAHLSWGYLDHPPGVALLGGLSRWWSSSEFATRFPGTLAATLAGCYAARIGRIVAPSNPWAPCIAFMIMQCSIGGFATGLLLNPDTGMVAAWTIAVHEALLALSGNRRRWLSAGLLCGVAILFKYIAVLLPLCILLHLAVQRRSELRSGWFVAGVFAGLSISSPHWIWNAQNDWITVRFQLTRGLASSHAVANQFEQQLPQPLAPTKDSIEQRMSDFFQVEREGEKKSKLEQATDAMPRPLARLVNFLGGQLGLWGLFVFILMLKIAACYKARDQTKLDELERFLLICTAVPLIVFGLVSLVAKVEANWAGVHIIGAGGIVASRTRVNIRWFAAATAVHLLLFTALAADPLGLGARLGARRILDETIGYRELAAGLSSDKPIFADKYQTVSMLRFQLSTDNVNQWPGLARGSEFVRRGTPPEVLAKLDATGFWLIVSGTTAPKIAGFVPVTASARYLCRDGSIQSLNYLDVDTRSSICRQQIKSWLLVDYAPESTE